MNFWVALDQVWGDQFLGALDQFWAIGFWAALDQSWGNPWSSLGMVLDRLWTAIDYLVLVWSLVCFQGWPFISFRGGPRSVLGRPLITYGVPLGEFGGALGQLWGAV